MECCNICFIYKNNSISKNIYREDTAFLVTDMLKDGAKNGTAKRLSDLPFDLASKTGTSSNIQKNIDAYNIGYVSSEVRFYGQNIRGVLKK